MNRLNDALFVLVLLLVVAPVTSGQTYAVSRDANLLEVDPMTGAVINTIPITGAAGFTALTIQPGTNVLFAVHNGASRELVTLDPATGTMTTIGPVSTGLAGISFAADGTLYGINGERGVFLAGDLLTIDPTNAMEALVASLGNPNLDGEEIAVNPSDGLIYRVDSEVLSSIDPMNGFMQTTIAPLSISEVSGMSFDRSGDILMGDISNDVFSVSTAGVVMNLQNNFSLGAMGIAQVGLFNLLGTSEDLTTEYEINGGSAMPVGHSAVALILGDVALIRHLSPLGTFNNAELAVIGSLAPTGTSITTPVDGLSIFDGGMLYSPVTGIVGSLFMAPGGISYTGTYSNAALSGQSTLVQAVAISTTAANLNYATTNALLIDFN